MYWNGKVKVTGTPGTIRLIETWDVLKCSGEMISIQDHTAINRNMRCIEISYTLH